MKLRSEPSANIQDLRSYFGTQALDPGYPAEARAAAFLGDALAMPGPDAPQQFQPRRLPTLDEMLNALTMGDVSRNNQAGIVDYNGGLELVNAILRR